MPWRGTRAEGARLPKQGSPKGSPQRNIMVQVHYLACLRSERVLRFEEAAWVGVIGAAWRERLRAGALHPTLLRRKPHPLPACQAPPIRPVKPDKSVLQGLLENRGQTQSNVRPKHRSRGRERKREV